MAEFRDSGVNFITGERGREIYEAVKDLPVIDYHCHLSPKEIYEDKPFGNIGEMWLAGDHYKWRLMRAYGIDEKYITGDADYREKFNAFIEAVSTAYGNPVRDWVRLELSEYFGITLPLKKENADRIWELTEAKIREEKLSPVKLIERSNVEYIATTDDPADSLEYHGLIAAEGKVKAKVVPSFRVDRMIMIDAPDYTEYLKKLSAAADIEIRSLADYEEAVSRRLDFFVSMGCRFSDMGIPVFPDGTACREEAEKAFVKALGGKKVGLDELKAFLGYIIVKLAAEYKKRGMVMQMHVAVRRNNNSAMYKKLGADSGFDSVGDPISVNVLAAMFDEMEKADGLPETIIYTLNPTMYYGLITLIGSFRGIHLGIAWWFNDHKRGMTESFNALGELSHVNTMVGMLTDSRSFLSYVRHGYYRQIVAEYLAGYADESNMDDIKKTATDLCYGNAKKLI